MHRHIKPIFTARRYTSAVFAAILLSIRPSVTSQYCIETTGDIVLVFGTEASFHLRPTLCYKEIWVSPKIRVRPSGTLSQTLDLENFATAS